MRPYILFGGDVVLTDSINQRSKRRELFCEELQKDIDNAEELVINLEAPLTDTSTQAFKSGPSLKSRMSYGKILPNIGVSIACLANNHMMDYSEEGLNDTLTSCNANNISTVGAGSSRREAREPLSFKANSKVISVVNIAENEFGSAGDNHSGIYTIDIFDNISLIREAKQKSDVLVVVLHAGVEHLPIPPPLLKKYCRFLIGEGVDAIICHHTHIKSAYEIIDGAPIFYGIGNFIFDSDNPASHWHEGYLVKFFIDDFENKFEIIPYEQNISFFGVRKLKGIKLTSFKDDLKKLNELLVNDDLYRKEWERYCSTKTFDYMILLYCPFVQWPVRLLKKVPMIEKVVFPYFRSPVRLNLLRCESHYEVVKEIHNQLFRREK
ncbi:CapA family protein [Salinivibrio costicola]|uniref:Capsule synthesis protein CapA domain-containing protein n=1 Tax=Salinivibrio costicola subsp. alcaliphilus TaxID=272773 RepID=A0ABX3KMU7_SALCS|nr:CapA family protein [Salinivibrio costicola]OOF32784.1 hypothetical protein BZJ21_14305 [Salinivibrio costicola subsp. alcaliphilus]